MPPAERAVARQRARAHWLLALGELEEPAGRPCLILVGGLPGTGKSTLARALCAAAGCWVLSSDVVRKELAGLSPADAAGADFGSGLYTADWNDRTYAACLGRAEEALGQGRRVVVDASFREERRRREFVDAARRWAVPLVFLLCRAQPDTVRARLAVRAGDASDADWAVYLRAAEAWEEPGPRVRGAWHELPCGGPREGALAAALDALRSAGLL